MRELGKGLVLSRTGTKRKRQDRTQKKPGVAKRIAQPLKRLLDDKHAHTLGADWDVWIATKRLTTIQMFVKMALRKENEEEKAAETRGRRTRRSITMQMRNNQFLRVDVVDTRDRAIHMTDREGGVESICLRWLPTLRWISHHRNGLQVHTRTLLEYERI